MRIGGNSPRAMVVAISNHFPLNRDVKRPKKGIQELNSHTYKIVCISAL